MSDSTNNEQGDDSSVAKFNPNDVGCPEDVANCNGPHDCKRSAEDCRELSKLKRSVNPDGKSMEECMGKSLESLSTAFSASARRWELIVYPSLAAFILLAAYGFFLIYSLTQDVSRVATSMENITQNMNQVSVNMDHISKNMVIMTQVVDSQSIAMGQMVASMQQMNHNMKLMNASMGRMGYDMAVMNQNVSRPMSFMNSFMPW